jgi:hypothetical protein
MNRGKWEKKKTISERNIKTFFMLNYSESAAPVDDNLKPLKIPNKAFS